MAMANPTAAEVASRLTLFLTKLTDATEKKDLLDTAQETLNNLASDVDILILRVWDEVESYFNSEPAESKRANAREWGVIYISIGSPTNLELTVLLPGGAPAVGYTVKLVDGRMTRDTDALGKVEMTTTLNGELRIEVQLGADTSSKFETTITVVESVTYTGTIQLT